ncbi:MAG: exo-alpha-sialidase [Kiritimatiellae bacterium]|nr:exo-alpha-sialidase [Kiritimatiellia bacterium]
MITPTTLLPLLITVLVLTLPERATAAPTLDQPRRVLELPPGPGNPRNSEGDLIALKDGRILLIYTRYTKGNGGDNDPAYLASRVSTDRGFTWSKEPVEVVKNEGGMNVMSVSLLRLQSGEIALFYLRKNSETDCRPYLRRSTDEAKSWSEPIPCVPPDPDAYYVLNNSRATQLKSGRIVLPLCWHSSGGTKRIADWAGEIVCYLSDDNGKTWRQGKQRFKTFDAAGKRVTSQEPGIIELKDGRVMMYFRTTHGQQWICHSTDGCETWSRPAPSAIGSPCSPATIKRLSNGDLFLVWNDHGRFPQMRTRGPSWGAGQRSPLAVAISKDEGKSWQGKVLEGNPNGWYCYTAALEVDGNLILEYCAEKMLQHARVTLVPIAWLYTPEPKPVAGGDGKVPLLNGFFND